MSFNHTFLRSDNSTWPDSISGPNTTAIALVTCIVCLLCCKALVECVSRCVCHCPTEKG